MVIDSLSYYPPLVPIFFSTIIDATFNNLQKSTHLLSIVIGLPCHGCQNFKKLGEEISTSRFPLPAHVLAFSRSKFTLILAKIKFGIIKNFLAPWGMADFTFPSVGAS